MAHDPFTGIQVRDIHLGGVYILSLSNLLHIFYFVSFVLMKDKIAADI